MIIEVKCFVMDSIDIYIVDFRVFVEDYLNICVFKRIYLFSTSLSSSTYVTCRLLQDNIF